MSVATRHNGSPAEDAAKVLIRAGLILLMVVLPCAGLFSDGAIYVLAPVGAILTLLGAAVGEAGHGPRQILKALRSPAGRTALFLAFWAGLSLLWTPFVAEAGQRFAQTVGTTLLIAFAAAYLPEKTRTFDLYLPPAGVALAAAGALLVTVAGAWQFGVGPARDAVASERSVIALVVLVWPALGALSVREHWTFAAGLAVLTAGAALAGFAQIALAAMGVGALAFALSMSEPKKTARVLACVCVPLILLAPALPFIYRLVAGAAAEPGPLGASMAVWADVVAGHWPRLITGHGLDTANRGLSLGFLPAATPKSLLFVIWYDLGLVGALALALLVAEVFALAGKVPFLAAPAVLAGLVAIVTLAFLGVATSQIWWVTLLNSAVVAFALLIKGGYRTQRPLAGEMPFGPDADVRAGAPPISHL